MYLKPSLSDSYISGSELPINMPIHNFLISKISRDKWTVTEEINKRKTITSKNSSNYQSLDCYQSPYHISSEVIRSNQQYFSNGHLCFHLCFNGFHNKGISSKQMSWAATLIIGISIFVIGLEPWTTKSVF